MRETTTKSWIKDLNRLYAYKSILCTYIYFTPHPCPYIHSFIHICTFIKCVIQSVKKEDYMTFFFIFYLFLYFFFCNIIHFWNISRLRTRCRDEMRWRWLVWYVWELCKNSHISITSKPHYLAIYSALSHKRSYFWKWKPSW